MEKMPDDRFVCVLSPDEPLERFDDEGKKVSVREYVVQRRDDGYEVILYQRYSANSSSSYTISKGMDRGIAMMLADELNKRESYDPQPSSSLGKVRFMLADLRKQVSREIDEHDRRLSTMNASREALEDLEDLLVRGEPLTAPDVVRRFNQAGVL
ncbi:hypothetical protein KHQ86_gp155 [Gordonia phage Stormageddon]|uniref:Uncharacterized protein n=1 Tax=Gordonia phage Stormageddon TaxID=2656541 RepID=A0A649VSM4_9CAUD|nr:hypothetical protein KHQ86_gp155 [Gordonia phage Stormageddon]QGJ95005.1 hypothetical protein SEA_STORMAGEDDON_145 [Gordonia phage Stormageddon]